MKNPAQSRQRYLLKFCDLWSIYTGTIKAGDLGCVVNLCVTVKRYNNLKQAFTKDSYNFHY